MKTFREHIVESAWRSCCDSPSQRNQPHIKGCKHYSPSEQDRYDDMEKHNVATIPGYKRRLPEETLHESTAGKSLHDSLIKDHGFTHKHPQRYGKPDTNVDQYDTDELMTPDYIHKAIKAHGYDHLTRSKADSRVPLDHNTHYEKEQMGSRHSLTVHYNSEGEVTHVLGQHHRVRD